MGARINYVFKNSLTKPSVVLYSHWGETEWQRALFIAAYRPVLIGQI